MQSGVQRKIACHTLKRKDRSKLRTLVLPDSGRHCRYGPKIAQLGNGAGTVMCRLEPKRASLVDLVVQGRSNKLASDRWDTRSLANLVRARSVQQPQLHGSVPIHKLVFASAQKELSARVVASQ
jgi:hypothetical protein